MGSKSDKCNRLEQNESQRLKTLAGNRGYKPLSKPPVQRVVLIIFGCIKVNTKNMP